MTQGGRFERFRDRFLTPWWSRYIVVPLLAAAPGALVAFWFKYHDHDAADYFLKGSEALAVFLCAGWAGVISAAKSALNDVAAFTVNELKTSRDQLVRLLGHVRVIVGAKSQRFHEALVDIDNEPNAGRLFLRITQPATQIKRIVESVHAFYVAGNSTPDERVMVSFMRWDAGRGHLVFLHYFPEADPPGIADSQFRDSSTVAGRAHQERHLVVCEDVANDARFMKVPGSIESGSMFAYPIQDPLLETAKFVLNVFSTRVGRFKEVDIGAIGVVMEVFGDRLLLENRLLQIRSRVEARGDI